MACVTISTRTCATDRQPRSGGGGLPTLALEDLTIEHASRRGRARLVDRVSLEVWPGEIVGLIGESGSGKTMTALSILGLLPRGVRVTGGDIRLSGRSLVGLGEAQLRAIRGDRIAMIPQDALRALNPVLRIDRQVGEPYVLHRRSPWEAARAKAVELLASVHLRASAERAREYPHQFSGGMQQRAMIAMGLALEPELLIADEPTSALDVTVQARVLQLLREIRGEHGTAILFITHDLGVVAELCDRVYVIYAGAIVEQAPVEAVFTRPAHPYTQALLRATPTVRAVQDELLSIPGQIPSPSELPCGCRFADRCPHRFERCTAEPPHLAAEADHTARCWLLEARGA
jgi:oligopeptide/dipeptide ABC transporter ATP-binding protein